MIRKDKKKPQDSPLPLRKGPSIPVPGGVSVAKRPVRHIQTTPRIKEIYDKIPESLRNVALGRVKNRRFGTYGNVRVQIYLPMELFVVMSVYGLIPTDKESKYFLSVIEKNVEEKFGQIPIDTYQQVLSAAKEGSHE